MVSGPFKSTSLRHRVCHRQVMLRRALKVMQEGATKGSAKLGVMFSLKERACLELRRFWQLRVLSEWPTHAHTYEVLKR